MSTPTDEEARAATRLDWTKRYRSARRIAHLVVSGRRCEERERAELLGWLAGHIAAYVETCAAQDWAWTSECESDRDEMTAWVSADLDLDDQDLGLSIPEQLNAAEGLCREAGWDGAQS
jgi:hypothetical protein